ncbi:MAG: sigma-54 dependent transcriptional regulator [Myxococcota bacterium]|nr:sigma-54 dependent transcriptional regulator [Myxococcota bacterium]
MSGRRVLIVDDEPIVRDALGAWLREDGNEVDSAEGGREAIEMVCSRSYVAVLLDVRMPGIDGIETLREMRRLVPDLPVIVMTAFGDVSTAVASMKAGAHDYVSKPFDLDWVSLAVRQLADRAGGPGALSAVLSPGAESWSYDDFAGRSPAMAKVIEIAGHVAATNIPVLLRGAKGLGKECLARAIHSAGARKDGPFVVVHCEGVAQDVLDYDLFGREGSAVSGAATARKGRVELSDRGTLYVDEVAAMPTALQVAFLNTLEDRAIVRVGSEARIPVDFRVISSTSAPIAARVAAGGFLDALLGKLSGIEIDVPPLRDRPEDIRPLAERLLARVRAEMGKPAVESIADDALRMLEAYDWPGNVRELRRALERAVVVCPGPQIRPEDLVFRPKNGAP